MKLDKIPTDIIADLVERGHTLNAIERMEADRAFDEFCNWNGLLGWGPSLRRAMLALKEAE